MNTTEELTEEQIKIMKHWLFKENARLENEKQKLREEREEFAFEKTEFLREKEAHFNMHDIMKNQLVREKQIFEQKWKILERELRNLAFEKEQFKKNKDEFAINSSGGMADILFSGVKNEKELKKRYKDLTKIFHPDSGMDDSGVMQSINIEYNKMKNRF